MHHTGQLVAAEEVVAAKNHSETNRVLPHGFVKKKVAEPKSNGELFSHTAEDTLQNEVQKLNAEAAVVVTPTMEASVDDNDDSNKKPAARPNGRPRNTAIAAEAKVAANFNDAKDWITTECLKLKQQAQDKNEKAKTQTLDRLIEEAHAKFSVPQEKKITKGAMESTVGRGCGTKHIVTPMAEMELLLVDICILADALEVPFQNWSSLLSHVN